MASICNIVRKANCDSLHQTADGTDADSEYLCYTRVCEKDDNWIVVLTDADDVWSLHINQEELDALRDQDNVQTIPAYLNKFKNGMITGELTVSVIGVKATVRVGKGSNTLTLDLYKSSASEKRLELRHILFHLARSCSSLRTSLDKAEQQVVTLQQKSAATTSTLDHQGGKKTAVQPKQAGMSIINPTSKKRKVAKGVNFD